MDRPASREFLYREMYAEYWPENLWVRGHLQDLGVDGGINIKTYFKMWRQDVDWIYVAGEWSHLRAILITVIGLLSLKS